MTAAVVALDGATRDYAWGSTSAVQQLLGLPVDGRRIAELWFDAQLPFLVKILAADLPLSIQVHPNRAQAQAGFAVEDARGVPLDAPQRNYRDRNHKPELLVAITEFDALCGFRPVADTQRLLAALGVPELGDVAGLLAGADPLRAAFAHLLGLADPQPLIDAVVAAAPERLDGGWAAAGHAVALAARHFPGDVGVVLTLLLNAVRLRPGEAVFLPAGTVHAYLRGTGVEAMASSDNVLRCGLTPKHVDVAELLAVTDFRPLAEPRVREHDGRFTVPVPDFAVRRVDLDAEIVALGAGGPHVLVCTSGTLTVAGREAGVTLTPGRAALVRDAAAAEATVGGPGCCVVVTSG